MKQKIGAFTILVRDYDEAIAFYIHKLSFCVTGDEDMGRGKRFVTIHPPADEQGTGIVLAKPSTKEQEAYIGRQGGDRVMFFLNTDDFYRDYASMRDKGVIFREEPRHEPYGIVAVFEDLYGNRWDLLEPK